MVGSKSSEDQEEASDPTRMNLPSTESKYIQMPKVVALNSLESKASFTGSFPSFFFLFLRSFFSSLPFSSLNIFVFFSFRQAADEAYACRVSATHVPKSRLPLSPSHIPSQASSRTFFFFLFFFFFFFFCGSFCSCEAGVFFFKYIVHLSLLSIYESQCTFLFAVFLKQCAASD